MVDQTGYESDGDFAKVGVVNEPLETAPENDATLARQAQLEALRTEIVNLRAELAAIVGGTSRLAVTEAVVALETTQNRIRDHLAPVLIAAAAIGYLWGASIRRR
ncbi:MULTISPECIES: hypothetical protein [Ensifer]|jgi:hypothetical protein|uniref:DUF883 domain-containing protein n=1 Tax=Ensifer canadensis TaxID=555315 RepID=A0AAW4FNH9_9HYPH|nr:MULTISPECIES: hypothetical protein [Ensifer]KQW34876.1 hypothetical protein ASD02_16745 [Ensifer sp. Root1252]KQW55629.1 hypothetical protein ASD03_18910 [Ensifer sp. Root127]KQY76969.1 hypothetical protein ASD52_23520 [Ensifer sp. Root142]KRC57200.1 hypothetical protein ASE32_20060 [Ensifer sp. Root231]KRC87695.1 hypothetical protein ASE47_14215 [Ensifer sp. Root258]